MLRAQVGRRNIHFLFLNRVENRFISISHTPNFYCRERSGESERSARIVCWEFLKPIVLRSDTILKLIRPENFIKLRRRLMDRIAA